ncbi:MAG TPA: helix-turn-helix domain-containing protein [Solirubrobacterales bacterium]|nr:helix-turn-helix domain-containing protein [Solirubrobacterales bacterium]
MAHNGSSPQGPFKSLQNGSLAAKNSSAKPAPAVPVNWERLARATAHPLRVSVLEILGLDGGRVLSPSDLSRELQIPLSNTNYHVTELAKSGLIELVRERQVRGATEHFYRLPAEDAGGRGDAGEQDADPEEEPRHPLAVS